MNDPLLAGIGGSRVDTEVGYGLPVGRRFVGTPRAASRRRVYGRRYRLGYGMRILEEGPLRLELGVEAETAGGVPSSGSARASLSTVIRKSNESEQIVDRNILGSGIGQRQAKATPDERAQSRRQGRQPREAGAERSEAP